MGQSLTEIAQSLIDNSNKKIQLIYAFNGTGKTRLSRKFRSLVDPKDTRSEVDSEIKVLYYNAYTEDLFYWDNDLEGHINRKLLIHPNSFTKFAINFLRDHGQDRNIASNFQYYTSNNITPLISNSFSEVKFSIANGGDDGLDNIKISKGEESNFIWCFFYSLLEQIVDVLNTTETEERPTDLFEELEYVFIDDPVSSLDDSHLIELAVNISTLIKSSQSDLKFIITTHNPLFFNVLYNELNNRDSRYNYRPKYFGKYLLEKLDDGTLLLERNHNDSPFSYHINLLSFLKKVAISNEIEKHHFNLLRNVLEKTATFLGHKHWGNLISKTALGDKEPYVKRILNVCSHSKHSGEETNIVSTGDKLVFKRLIKEISSTYQFNINTEEISL